MSFHHSEPVRQPASDQPRSRDIGANSRGLGAAHCPAGSLIIHWIPRASPQGHCWRLAAPHRGTLTRNLQKMTFFLKCTNHNFF